jgi:hypothetical protein
MILGGLVAAVALSASGCTEECTAVGCTDSITVSFSTAVPRDYKVDIELDGKPGSADCSEATHPGGGDVEVEVTGLGRTIRCTQTGALLQGAPENVRLVFTFPDAKVADVTLKPKYQTVEPNGPECEPTCDQAEVTVDLP